MSKLLSLLFSDRDNESLSQDPAISCDLTIKHLLLDELSQIIFRIDDQGNWSFLNPAWEKLTGFSVEKCLQTPYYQYIHPDDRRSCIENLLKLLEKEDSHYSTRLRFMTNDNQLCWMDMRTNSILNKVTGRIDIIGSMSDVTNRVHESGLYQASYRTLSTILDNMCGLVYRGRNNVDWTMEYVSSGCKELTGYSSDDLINRSVTFASLIHPNDRESVWNEVQTALANNRPFEMIYRIHTATGEEKWVWEKGRGNFSDSYDLLSIEGFITDITEWKGNYMKSLHGSLYTEDTNLPRRRLFIDRLEIAVKHKSFIKNYNFALLLVHIAHLRNIADRYGPEIMTKIISVLSYELQQLLRPLDTLSRLKLDEFGILIEHVDDIDFVAETAQKIHAALNRPFKINDFNIFVTTNIGIALSSGSYDSADSMIRDASTALNKAKSLGTLKTEIFDRAINSRVRVQTRMKNELATATDNGELKLLYRPVMPKIEHNQNVMEIALAWLHPRRGLLQAGSFIPSVDNLDTLGKINKFVIASLTETILLLDNAKSRQTSMKLRVSLYSPELLKREYLLKIRDCFAQTRCSDISLTLAIPQHFLLSENQDILDELAHLRNYEIDICLDLCASGLLSTNLLALLPIHSVKISTAWLRNNMNREHLINSVINLLHSIDVEVTLTDVNSSDAYQLSQSFDWNYRQGDAIAEAIEYSELEKLLTTES